MKREVRERWERALRFATWGCANDEDCPNNFDWTAVTDWTDRHQIAASIALDGLDISELP